MVMLIMVVMLVVVLVTLQVELLLSLLMAGFSLSHLTSNDIITVETFLIKHRHV